MLTKDSFGVFFLRDIVCGGLITVCKLSSFHKNHQNILQSMYSLPYLAQVMQNKNQIAEFTNSKFIAATIACITIGTTNTTTITG
jgi:hypothetical protein